MSKPNDHTSCDELIFDLLDAALPADQQAELHAWLSESPKHWDRFMQLSFLHSQIAHQRRNQSSFDAFRLNPIQPEPEEPLPPIHIDADALTKKKIVSALSYVAEHTITPARIAAFAAVATVLLGVVLAVVLMSGPDAPDQIVEQSSQELDAEVATTPTKPAVATLTATRNAQWAEGDLAPGSALDAGQILTLTQGFAEITTRDGAVVTLESPASVEIIDSPNALRLRAGKLVGICETQSSKGFTVHTPQLDVIDFGTRFGVSVKEAGGSIAHVFEGLVGVKPNAAASVTLAPRKLSTGETIVLDQRGQETAPTSADGQAFVRLARRVGGIAHLSGQVDWADAATFLGADESTWTVADRAILFEEVRGFTLTERLPLGVVSPNRSQQAPVVTPGTTISTYILLFNPGGPQPAIAEGVVAFEGEILGVVIGDEWDESLRVLGNGRDVDLFIADQKHRTIESEFDSIDLLDDGQALAFKLRAGYACDVIRIVVREPEKEFD